MPWWEETPGFSSNSLLIDRATGAAPRRSCSRAGRPWRTPRDQFTTLREEFARRMGMAILDVVEFDVALAHLRVPETV